MVGTEFGFFFLRFVFDGLRFGTGFVPIVFRRDLDPPPTGDQRILVILPSLLPRNELKIPIADETKNSSACSGPRVASDDGGSS